MSFTCCTRGIKLDKIEFYIREQPYGFLSNFWRHPQTVREQYSSIVSTYPTNEHYYQSMKARERSTAEWIASAPTAFLAMKAGRSLPLEQMQINWEEEKVNVMMRGLRAKFDDPNMALLLDWTGNAKLVEASPVDMFWGGLLPGSKNMLGECLMKVREENRKTTIEDFEW